MKFKEGITFMVFMGSLFFYDFLPITCTVLLLMSLAGLYSMAKKSEKKGECNERIRKRRTGRQN